MATWNVKNGYFELKGRRASNNKGKLYPAIKDITSLNAQTVKVILYTEICTFKLCIV